MFFFAESLLAPVLAWAAPSERAAAHGHSDSRAPAPESKPDTAPNEPDTKADTAPAPEEQSAKGAGSSGVKKAPTQDAKGTAAEPPPLNQPLALPNGADKSGVTGKAISLPQGSGKIDGMGESFSAQLSTGIATFSVPFSLLKARGGAQPSLGLSYSSSGGFGLAGVGWDVGVPFIARQTDRGIPTYDDRADFHANQDHFVFNGGQELVPICLVVGNTCSGAPDEVMPSWATGAQYFRARVEGSFMRFFWSPDHRTWRVQDKSGVTMELGVPLDGSNDTSALERNPSTPSQIYRWRLVRQYDAQGEVNPAGPALSPLPRNVVVYQYYQHGGTAFLADIFDTTPAATPTTTTTSLFAHHTHLAYEFRSDPTFSYRSGWRMDQALRLNRVDVAAKGFAESSASARHQVRRYHLSYANQHASLLTGVQIEGRCAARESDAPAEANASDAIGVARATELLPASNCERLPPMTFDYSHVKSNADIPGYEGFDHTLVTLQNSPPHSVDEEWTELFDVNSDGLPDVLNTSVGTYGYGHGVFFNSTGGKAGAFGAATLMSVQGVLGANANTLTFRNLNLVPLDLDGDGSINLLHMPQVKTYSTYAPVLANGTWSWVGREVSTASAQSPKIDFGKDTLNTKVMDVNGDGLVDVVVSTGTEYQTFLALGRFPGGDGQFGRASLRDASSSTISNDPVRACVPWSSTPLQLSDPDAQVGDMNGDGLPDLVRLRRGDIRYWPGRGDGTWGTGDPKDCTAGKFSSNAFISMGGPTYSDIQGTSLRMDDVNGDGLDDLVQVRFDAIDIWFNVDGKGWTDRHIIPNTPASPSYASRVRLVDVNGSGTRDILWGTGKKYQYIDLEGGQKSFLLTRVENGLGKNTDIEYTTSTAEMIAADSLRQCDPKTSAQLLATSPWGCAWAMKMPTVAHVVKRVTESDNLPVASAAGGKYVTEYQYRDPLFEGRQREFRGFTRARSKRIGDANSPSDYTESAFLLGECEDETPTNAVDECSLSERWRDNPREALKGLPVFTEKYDERGVFLSTDSSRYRLRQLFVGLDGRVVRQAFESAKQTVIYDTAAGPAASAAASSVTSVNLELVNPGASWNPIADQVATPGQSPATLSTIVASRDSLVPVRSTTGTAVMSSASDVDFQGNKLVGYNFGCHGGSACPGTAEDGIVPDETIVQVTKPSRVAADLGGWLWRTTDSWVTGSVHQMARNHTHVTYDAFGNPLTTTAELAGAGQLDRVNSAPAGSVPLPTGASAGPGPTTITVSTSVYNGLGLLARESGANLRCRDVSYESDSYAEFATGETIHTSGGCNGTATLATGAAYDRGWGAPTQVVDMQSQATSVSYDAFGRLSELHRPRPDQAGAASTTPSVRVSYTLPSPSNPVKYSVIHTETQDGATDAEASYLESYSYIDGMGRTVVSLAEADKTANDLGAFVASGFQSYDAKSAVARKYLPSFYDGDPLQFPLGQPLTAVQYGRQRYDAFGRQVQTFDLDGTVTLQSVYHALSSDLYDAADLENGPHQGSCASTRSDGHGRTIATTERLHVGGAIEAREVRSQYLTTGEPEVITRVRVNKSDLPVVRWMKYDTLGHLVLNVDPNTTQNFTSDRTVSDTPSSTGLKAWRYAYNDAGDLVGTSDARGCGENFTYDGAGRLLTEDYVPCGQPTPYSLPVDATLADPTGYEVVYHYDSAPEQPFEDLPLVVRPSSYVTTSSNFVKGRLVAVWSRGKAQWISYDGRGRVVQTSVLPALPLNTSTRIAPNALTDRYGGRWYYREFLYDAADRELSATTGSTVAQLQGTAATPGGPTSAVTTSYSARGTVKQVGSTYDALVSSVTRTADGLVSDITYGDVAHTTTHSDFDARRRLRNVQTYRGRPNDVWGLTSNYTPLPPSTGQPTSFQLVLQDQELTYDAVGNPTEIRDYRSPEDWPGGAKPLTKKIQYDDLYRATRIDYQVAGATDSWKSPFAAELAGVSDPRRATPGTHVSFASRPLFQKFSYDWLGNTQTSDDDAHGFYDRSLGTIVNDTPQHPYQLKSASNKTSVTAPANGGSFSAVYDAAGNLTRANLERIGPCLPVGSPCSARFQYYWDEVGRLSRAFRSDAEFSKLPSLDYDASASTWFVWDPISQSYVGSTSLHRANTNLDFLYDESDDRIVKTSTNADRVSVSTLYPYETLEVRGTELTAGATPLDTTLSADNEVPYLAAHGVRLGRVVYEPMAKGEPRLGAAPGVSLHVFFELGDHLGSTSVVIDKATSELVEASTYQAYGAKESDYRPDRWQGFREDYGFTGKEEDVEFGLVYFGKRYLNTYVGRWLSADPLAVHQPGKADLNLYAYVRGLVLAAVDVLGLDGTLIIAAKKTSDPRANDAEQAKHKGISVQTLIARRVGEDAGFVRRSNVLKARLESRGWMDVSTASATNGQQFLNRLEAASSIDQIKNLAVYHHGTNANIIMKEDAGLFSDPAFVRKPQDGVAFLKDLKARVDAGKIKFSSDATILLLGCNCGGMQDRDSKRADLTAERFSFAARLAETTGARVIASVGYSDVTKAKDDKHEYSEGAWFVFDKENRGGRRLDAENCSGGACQQMRPEKYMKK